MILKYIERNGWIDTHRALTASKSKVKYKQKYGGIKEYVYAQVNVRHFVRLPPDFIGKSFRIYLRLLDTKVKQSEVIQGEKDELTILIKDIVNEFIFLSLDYFTLFYFCV
jgi:hypothetical protein